MIPLAKAIYNFRIVGRGGLQPNDTFELTAYLNLAYQDIAQRAHPLELTTSNDEIGDNIPLVYLDDKYFIKKPKEIEEGRFHIMIELDEQLFDAFVYGICHKINPQNQDFKAQYYKLCSLYKQAIYNERFGRS